MATANTRCCETCRLRFTPDAAHFLTQCPECDALLTQASKPRQLVGFRLFDPMDIADVIAVPAHTDRPAPTRR